MIRRPPRSPLFPYPPLSRPRTSVRHNQRRQPATRHNQRRQPATITNGASPPPPPIVEPPLQESSSHPYRTAHRSEEHTSELQSQSNLVCRLLLEKKKNLEIRAEHGGMPELGALDRWAEVDLIGVWSLYASTGGSVPLAVSAHMDGRDALDDVLGP